MKKQYVGDGKVELIAGGGKIYTDIAARFIKSERSLEEIIGSPYSKRIVQNIINSGHEAAVEFDFFIFGVEGYARVSEVQLVRKRLASYMIKSGRAELNGKREFSVVIPNSIDKQRAVINLDSNRLTLMDGTPISKYLPDGKKDIIYTLNTHDILNIIEEWYDQGIRNGTPEEDLRYLKPQATEYKALIGMNAHALRDWFRIRCCMNAQKEIRDLANKMLKLCKQAAPDLFEDAGPNCIRLGYCPENDLQHESCNFITKDRAMEILKGAS